MRLSRSQGTATRPTIHAFLASNDTNQRGLWRPRKERHSSFYCPRLVASAKCANGTICRTGLEPILLPYLVFQLSPALLRIYKAKLCLKIAQAQMVFCRKPRPIRLRGTYSQSSFKGHFLLTWWSVGVLRDRAFLSKNVKAHYITQCALSTHSQNA